jgi:hypothetical protein
MIPGSRWAQRSTCGGSRPRTALTIQLGNEGLSASMGESSQGEEVDERGKGELRQ